MPRYAKTFLCLASAYLVVTLTAIFFASQAHAEESGAEGSDTRSKGSDTRDDGKALFGKFKRKAKQLKQEEQGSDTRDGSGSSTRDDDVGEPVHSSKRRLAKHQRPEPTQVDPELADQVTASAAEIDRLVMTKLRAEKVRPNPLTNDMQFVRRVYLDITGTIPTARKTAAFLKKSRNTDKRAELIDELLNSSGYASHSFNYWADLLRLRDMPSNNNEAAPYVEWIKDVQASDMPYDEFVGRLLTAEGRVWEDPAAGYTLRDLGMPLSNLDNTVRIFLGTRIGCAQCHDHPFDRWTQIEFYQLAAFMHGTQTSANRREINRAVADARQELRELPTSNENGRLRSRANQFISANQRAVGEDPYRNIKLPHDYQYDDAKPGQVMQPAVLFGEQPELAPSSSRRQALARWMTSPENPRFTLTIANRLWKRALGVGLIEPIDDLTDESEATNPELMDFLVSEMKRVGFRQRELLRIIYNTQAYQREASRRELMADDPYHFPGPVLRRMTAEQIWDSLLTLTLADPNRYQRPPSEEKTKYLAIEPDEKLTMTQLLDKVDKYRQERRNGVERQMQKKYSHEGVLLVRASEMQQPMRPSHFLRQFGQSDRELLAGGTTEGHVPQILTMFNGPISHKLLNEGTLIYDEVVAAPDLRDKIDVIFLSILSRKPSRTDRKLAAAEIQSNGPAGFGNVIWALLNTREFLFIQ